MVAPVGPEPIDLQGAVLAGGLGTRMGTPSKPATGLAGRPLIEYSLEALAAVCGTVSIVCKRDTELPPLSRRVARWDEPDQPRHPLTGIVYALERRDGPVLVCAADMPFVEAASLRRLAAHRGEAVAVVARAGGHLQPLLALYAPEALEVLRAAAADAPLTATVAALDPLVLEVPDRDAVSVDTPQALEHAEAYLRGLSA